MATQLDDPRIIEFDVRTDEMLVNMGPQHPSTHGVLRLVLRTDGEVVSEVTPHIGYLHRCAEKIGENLTARQWIPYTDRMDYLAGMNMNLGWALTVEKLMNLELPEKARHLRVLIAELNRILDVEKVAMQSVHVARIDGGCRVQFCAEGGREELEYLTIVLRRSSVLQTVGSLGCAEHE